MEKIFQVGEKRSAGEQGEPRKTLHDSESETLGFLLNTMESH